MNYSINRISLYTLPIIISSIIEELMILTDSVLLSFKDSIFLSTIGIIDSIYLLTISYGESLNDSFQNYFARNSQNILKCSALQGDLYKVFLFFAGLICTIIALLTIACSWLLTDNSHISIIIGALPFLLCLIGVTYYSLSMNSFLMGLGKIKILSIISIIAVFINALLGYILLFVLNITVNSCCVILCTSIISELISCICMKLVICKIVKKNSDKVRLSRKRLTNILIKAAIYPSLSTMLFHLGSLALYTYCIYTMIDSETAQLVLFMSYWGVVQVPTDSFSETSLNIFSSIYGEKLHLDYYTIKRRLFLSASIFIVCLTVIMLLIDSLVYGWMHHNIFYFAYILVIVMFNTNLIIAETGFLVRLKNDNYLKTQIIYGLVLSICLVILWLSGNVTISHIFSSFIIAQLCCWMYINRQEREIWKSFNFNM